jgi:hypothetical protein
LNVVKLRLPSLLKNGTSPHSIIAISRPPSIGRICAIDEAAGPAHANFCRVIANGLLAGIG